MKEALISYDTAKLAKEKGFDIETEDIYDDNFRCSSGQPVFINNKGFLRYSHKCDTSKIFFVPTQSLLQKWLREERKLNLCINFECVDDSEFAYTYRITWEIPEGVGRKKNSWDFYDHYDCLTHGQTYYATYEEALEKGLVNTLKRIPAEKTTTGLRRIKNNE